MKELFDIARLTSAMLTYPSKVVPTIWGATCFWGKTIQCHRSIITKPTKYPPETKALTLMPPSQFEYLANIDNNHRWNIHNSQCTRTSFQREIVGCMVVTCEWWPTIVGLTHNTIKHVTEYLCKRYLKKPNCIYHDKPMKHRMNLDMYDSELWLPSHMLLFLSSFTISVITPST